MARVRRKVAARSPNEFPLAFHERKIVPHEFVLEALSPISPWTRPMFGCLAVYVGEKIIFALRDRPQHTADNGVWIATTEEHHAALRRDFPNIRSIQVFGKPITSWQILASDAPDFEESVLRACDLVLARDPRIGTIPKSRRSRAMRSRESATTSADAQLEG